jgi:hypothetical protein
MIGKVSAAAAMVLAIAGCAAPTPVRINAPFNAEEAKNKLRPGSNAIVGSALIRQRGGGVVTCAGNSVHLVPVTPYAVERIGVIYGSGKLATQRVNFENTPPGYVENTRSTTCNAQGFFRFEGLADGDYFVQTSVTWMVGQYNMQGGAMYQRASVSGGQILEVTITP